MQLESKVGMPSVPDLGRLAYGAVAAARHVADDAIEAVQLRVVRDQRQLLRLVARDQQPLRVDAERSRLVRQHVGSLGVAVVREHEALDATRRVCVCVRQHGIERLARLGARRGAHVQHAMMVLDLQHGHRHHADLLLASHEARAGVGEQPPPSSLAPPPSLRCQT